MRSLRGLLGTLVVLTALSAAVPTQAFALEVVQPYVGGGFAKDTSNGAPINRGLYVIADSISLNVPYEATLAATGRTAWTRAHAGWVVRSHRYTTGWPGSSRASVNDAAASNASTVFFQLGTNDLSCLHYSASCTSTPRDTDPSYGNWAYGQKLGILMETKAAIDQLTQGGKCVIWAGPREIDLPGYGVTAADYRWFNQWIKDYANQAQNRGKVFYGGYHEFVQGNPDLRYDLITQGDDPIHPSTAAGRQAIANLALYVAGGACHMP